jgi:hypothetical protein
MINNADLGESSYEGEREVLNEERKQREQLLELNHLIARQVMEKSRMVAGKHFWREMFAFSKFWRENFFFLDF